MPSNKSHTRAVAGTTCMSIRTLPLAFLFIVLFSQMARSKAEEANIDYLRVQGTKKRGDISKKMIKSPKKSKPTSQTSKNQTDGDQISIAADEKVELVAIKAEWFGGMQLTSADQAQAGARNPMFPFKTSDFLWLTWEIEDTNAIQELLTPIGHYLSPITILQGDTPTNYIVLNIYFVEFVAGQQHPAIRFEWSTFTTTDDDPVPRFMVLEALTNVAGLDSVSGETDASNVQYTIKNGIIAASSDAFQTRFSISDLATNQTKKDGIALSPDFYIASDKNFWLSGVYDKALYNSDVFSSPIISIDPETVHINDETVWGGLVVSAQPEQVLFYPDLVEFIIKPWFNLNDPALGLDPNLLAHLNAIKCQTFAGISHFNAKQASLGKGEALIDLTRQPSALYVNFPIKKAELERLEGTLPHQFKLAKMKMTAEGEAQYIMTVRVFEGGIDLDKHNGLQADWILYTEIAGSEGVYSMVIDSKTSPNTGLNAADLFSPPAEQFVLDVKRDKISVDIVDGGTSFFIEVPTTRSTKATLHVDWLSSNARIYARNGVYDAVFCDGLFYDADVMIIDPSTIALHDTSPWASFIDDRPLEIIVFNNMVECTMHPWFNLEEMPVKEEILQESQLGELV